MLFEQNCVDYFLTQKLSQDHVEMFFALIKCTALRVIPPLHNSNHHIKNYFWIIWIFQYLLLRPTRVELNLLFDVLNYSNYDLLVRSYRIVRNDRVGISNFDRVVWNDWVGISNFNRVVWNDRAHRTSSE